MAVLLELVSAADRLLLDPLKQRAALCLVPTASSPGAAVPLLRLAEQTCCVRLADAAAAAVAEQLEALARDAELAACVSESAARIRGRQAADSIPVLDDIAMHVSRLHGIGGDLSDEEEDERWRAPPIETAAQRAGRAEAMRTGAASERRRKTAVLAQLAASVQGWDVAAARVA